MFPYKRVLIQNVTNFRGYSHAFKISESTETPNTPNLRMKKENYTSSFSKSGERTKKKSKAAILLVAPLGLVAYIVP